MHVDEDDGFSNFKLEITFSLAKIKMRNPMNLVWKRAETREKVSARISVE